MKFQEYKKNIQDNFDISLAESNIRVEEAAFSMKDLEKVSKLLAKIASKKLGADFQYAWTDKFQKNDNKKGTGARYMSPEGLQIRFNSYFKSNSSFILGGVDFWKKGDTLLNPSLTLTWDADVNIVKIKEQLFAAIKSGKAPVITAGDLVESKEAMKAFAKEHGIPSGYAGSNKSMIKKVDRLGLTAEFEEWMQIKTNVSEQTEFARQTDTEQLKLKDTNFYADPKYVFDDIREGTKVIAKGHWRSMIVAGMGGIGKTFGVKETLTQMHGPYQEGTGGKWAYYEGMKGLGMGYYITFLLNKNKIVVVDDSDSIWYKGNLNFMKIITSDSGDRQPTWAGSGTANVSMMDTQEREIYELRYLDAVQEDPNTTFKPPSKFAFTGSFINISNMKGEDFDGAIKSRSIFIDVYLAQRDVIRRMATIMEFMGRSPERIMDVLSALDPDAEDALNGTGRYSETPQYMTPEEARKNKQLNMRSVGITDALIESGAKGWRRMAGLYS